MNIKIITPIGELELDKEIGFGINISLDDILDISKKNSTYTKTILMPGTKVNNQIMGDLFDINSTFTFFNPNHKIGAKLVLDGTILIDGFIQLLEVKKLNNNDLQGNTIQYSVKMSDKVIDFYSEIKDKLLSDLDFSDYNHIINRVNIENSWYTHTYEDVYVYPLMHKTSNIYNTSDFKPSIFHKAYLLKIFQEAGYSLGGSFIEDNLDYEKEIIPFNGDIVEIPQTELDRRKFRVSTSATTLDSSLVFLGTSSMFDLGVHNYRVLDDETTPPNFDTNNHWNPVAGSWTVDRNGKYNLNGNLIFNIEFDSSGIETWKYDGVPFNNYLNGPSNFKLEFNMFVNGVYYTSLTPGSQFMPWEQGTTNSTFNAANSYKVTNTFYVQINRSNIPLLIGDVITFQYNLISLQPSNYRDVGTSPISGNEVDINISVYSMIGSTLYNSPLTAALSDDDTVYISEYIPKKIKQSDILNDVVKRYNLVIRTDSTNSKKILLDSRDDFYASGITLDWSDKKDNSNQDSIKLLSELQNKDMLFTYKSGKDLYNEDYTNSIDDKDIYGQKKITFNNEFVKGEKKVETTFSPTPLVYSSANMEMILPYIGANKPKNNIRVLYWGGMKSTLNDVSGNPHLFIYNSIDSGVPTTTTYTIYPYAGHFNDPIEPTVDINWGLNPYYFYSEISTSPNNNLYNTYWRNTIRQISEGRLLTTKFKLNEVDISNIKNNLNAKIWVTNGGNGSYYHINKIIDYNPVGDGLTKVELIKIVEGVAYTEQQEDIDIILTPYETLINTIALNPPPTTRNNTIESDNTIVVGGNNRVSNSSPTSLIIGDGNTIESRSSGSSIIGGTGNTISTNSERSSIIGGSNNTIEDNVVNGIIIGGENKTITESNTILIGDLIISGSSIISGIDFCASGLTTSSINGCTSASVINFKGAFQNDGCTASAVLFSGNVLYSHAEGFQTIASGIGSHTEGVNTVASGFGSHAEGNLTIASGVVSHAEGDQTIASGIKSHAEGFNTTASGDYSHAEGNQTVASGDYSHVEGYQTIASGDYSHAEGFNTVASGFISHSEGWYATASGFYSHAEGAQTIASGDYSHAEGDQTIASGDYSHAEGFNTTASAFVGHTEGAHTIASGIGGHAEGFNTIASGDYSHSGGVGSASNYIVADGKGSFAHFGRVSSVVYLGAKADYSAILGGIDNNIEVGNDRSVILGGYGITASAPDTVYVPNLNIQSGKGISFGTSSTIIFIKMDIGDWDMDVNSSKTLTHGLTSTEWKTITNISIMIRNDVDSSYNNDDGRNLSINGINSTTIEMVRLVGGSYDNVNYDSTSYNRGWVTFWYTPD